MADIDAILEAEQSIQTIASELQRMRDGADLLRSSQVQIDAVLSSAQEALRATDVFTGKCGMVIERLAATDLGERLDSLRAAQAETASMARELREEMVASSESQTSAMEKMISSTTEQVTAARQQAHEDYEQLSALLRSHQELAKETSARISAQVESLADEMRRSIRSLHTRQVFELALSGVTLLIALVALIALLISGLA